MFQGTFRWFEPAALLKLPQTGAFSAEILLDFAKQDVIFKFDNFNSLTYLTTGSAPGFTAKKGFQQGFGPNARYQITGTYLELPSTNCIPCVVTLDAKFLNDNDLPAGKGEFFVLISGSGINSQTPVFVGTPQILP